MRGSANKSLPKEHFIEIVTSVEWHPITHHRDAYSRFFFAILDSAAEKCIRVLDMSICGADSKCVRQRRYVSIRPEL